MALWLVRRFAPFFARPQRLLVRSSRHRRSFLGYVLLLCLIGQSAEASFSVRYIVKVPQRTNDKVEVRWELAGAEEVRELFLVDPEQILLEPKASGELHREGDGWRWAPGGPYGHLQYTVATDRTRGSQQRYDSYKTDRWLVTRGRVLFPRAQVTFRTAQQDPRLGSRKAQGFLVFQLPKGWTASTAYSRQPDGTFRLPEASSVAVPRGWFALGEIRSDERDIAGVRFEIARVPGSRLDPDATFAFLDATFPLLLKLLVPPGSPTTPQKLLVVSAPDPMWRGGISGQRSLYLHGDRPLRDVDRTSPILHELFHILQPFRPAADADWIVEGLAEFYSLELQRRAGLIDNKAYNKALRSFRKYGLWGVDLRQQRDNAATNNSAPLVLHALDQQILKRTGGMRRLDDVLALAANEKQRLTTRRFAALCSKVAGGNVDRFFEKYVYRGETPLLHSNR